MARYIDMKHTDLDLSTRRIAARFSILRFRHLLEEHGLRPKILQVINATLATRGLLLKAGTVVGATVVGTAANANDVTQGHALPGPCKKPPHKSSRCLRCPTSGWSQAGLCRGRRDERVFKSQKG
jgi:IS5 family transposase